MTIRLPLLLAALLLAAGLASAQAPVAAEPRPVIGLAPALVGGPTEALAFTAATAAGQRVVAAVPATAELDTVRPDGDGADGPPALTAVGRGLLLVAARQRPAGTELWSRVWRLGRWHDVAPLPSPTAHAYRPAVAGGSHGAWAVWLGITAGGVQDLYAARWSEQGWSPVERLPRAVGAPTPGVVSLDRDGEPMVAWVASDGHDSEIWISRRRAGVWSRPSALSDNDVPDAQPSIGSDARGRAVVAWASFEPDGYRPWAALQQARGFRVRRLDRSTGSSPVVVDGATPQVVWGTPEGERVTRLRTAARDNGRWRRRRLQGRFHSRFDATAGADGLTVAWSQRPEVGLATEQPTDDDETGPKPAGRRHGTVPTRTGGEPTLPGTWRGFGDSITVGTLTESTGEVSDSDGYIVPLQTTLSSFTETPIVVINSGVGGEVTPDGLGRIAGLMLSDPSLYTLIHEGTNDVTGLAENPDVALNLEAMAQLVTRAGCIPFLSTLLPRPPGDSQGLNVRVDQVNALLPEAALRQDAVLVDMYAAFMERWEWYSDTVHPNPDGYAHMADTWFVSLRPILQQILLDGDVDRDRQRDEAQRAAVAGPRGANRR